MAHATLRTIGLTHSFTVGDAVALSVQGMGSLRVHVSQDATLSVPDGYRVDVEDVDEGVLLVVGRLLGASAGVVDLTLSCDGRRSTIRLDVSPGKLSWGAVRAMRAALRGWCDGDWDARVEQTQQQLETWTRQVVTAQRRLDQPEERRRATPLRRPPPTDDTRHRAVGGVATQLAKAWTELDAVVDPQRRQRIAAHRARLTLGTGPARSMVMSGWVRSSPLWMGVYRVQEGLRDWSAPQRPPSLRVDLDGGYELWCIGQLALALARWGGVAWTGVLTQGGWPRDRPLLDVARGTQRVRMWVEPEYAWEGDTRFVKSVPGRPWRPDVALELVRAGVGYRLHLFDAKHRRDQARPAEGYLPVAAIEDAVQRYGETIRERGTHAQVVDSVWVLWPGTHAAVVNMAGAVPGGGVSAVPGDEHLDGVLDALLDTLL